MVFLLVSFSGGFLVLSASQHILNPKDDSKPISAAQRAQCQQFHLISPKLRTENFCRPKRSLKRWGRERWKCMVRSVEHVMVECCPGHGMIFHRNSCANIKWLKIMGYHGVHLRTSSPAVTFSFGGHPKLHHPSNFDETGFRGLGETIFNRNHNHKSCSFQLNSRCGGAAVTLYCTSIPLYLRIFSFLNPYFLFETNSQKFLRWQDSNPVFCLIFLEGGSGSTDHLPGRLPSLGRLGCDRWWDATW